MKVVERGILPNSVIFPLTPSKDAKQLLFYPTLCGHYYCNSNYFIQRNSYPPLLVIYVRSGTLKVEYRRECKRAGRGDVLLLDCSESHYYHAEGDLEFLYMHFDGANAHELCRYITDLHGWLIQRDTNVMIGRLLYDMVELCRSNRIETAFDSSMRIYRLFELLLAPTRQEQASGKPIEDAIHYIREHVGKQITLEELARVAKLSPYYFLHTFKQQTGFSPMEYVINTRIERAKSLLVQTTKSVSEIAYEVGYLSSGSLINLFIKRVGISPKQYRREHTPTQRSNV